MEAIVALVVLFLAMVVSVLGERAKEIFLVGLLLGLVLLGMYMVTQDISTNSIENLMTALAYLLLYAFGAIGWITWLVYVPKVAITAFTYPIESTTGKAAHFTYVSCLSGSILMGVYVDLYFGWKASIFVCLSLLAIIRRGVQKRPNPASPRKT